MLHHRAIVTAALAAGLGAGTVGAATVDHTGWFTFQVPWNDTSRNATNLAWGVEAPAGAHGFVKVGPDGHFQYDDGTRARFSGFVSVAQANLPDSADALPIAAHLRRFGVNFMRVHLTDVDGVYGLFAHSSTNTIDLDPDKMRRLDWFLKCLKDQGISYNFCVQSGRVFKTGDGIPAPIGNDQSKYVSLFDPVLIGLQKGLAASLANHVNAYTGLAYRDDPAVATWELTNENQLFLAWLSWGSSAWDSAATGGISGYYSRELDSLWNGWLLTRYSTDSALSVAWSGTASTGANLVQNPSFETNLAGWGSWADPTTAASFRVSRAAGGLSGGAALRVAVLSQGNGASDASVDYTGMTVAQGTSYRLRFWIKGTVPSSVQSEFLKEGVWTWYGSTTFRTDTTWKLCEAFFTAPADIADSLRFNIDFGLSEGTFLVDSVEFAAYGGDALRPGESLASRNLSRSSRSTVGALSDGRARDEARFYADLEGRYLSTLRGWLRDSLGVRVPVTFTNNWYGQASIASQARADYTDAHWYWQHPSFPNGWSATDYTIGNTPMVKDPDGGTAAQFSWSRVAGKPFVGSEYNHPFPSQYLCEAPAFYFGYMGFLDADGALMHAYIDYTPHYKDLWNDQFFNVGTNPVLMTQMPLAHLFRTGKIAPAAASSTVDVSESDWTLSAKRFQDGFPLPGSRSALLVRPLRWGSFAADSSTGLALPDPGPVVRTSTGEISWDRSAGILSVDNPFWQGAVGFLHAGTSTSHLALSGIATTGGRDFAAVHLVSTDSLPLGRARRMLLLTSARVENQSTVWNAAMNALTRVALATDTTLCEPVTGVVSFDAGRRDSVSVYRLDSRGNRVEALSLGVPADATTFLQLALPGNTLWYEIAVGDATSPRTAVDPRTPSSGSFRLVGDRERPVLLCRTSSPGRLEVEVRDLRGRLLSRIVRALPVGSTGVGLAPWTGAAMVSVRLSGASGTLRRNLVLPAL
jgi:hypothetical protein